MTEHFDNRQLRGLSEEQYSHVSPGGQVISCMRELVELNREW